MRDPETGTDFIFAHISISDSQRSLNPQSTQQKPNAQTAVKDYKSQKKVFSVFCLLSFKTPVNTFNEVKDSQQNSKTE